MERHLPEAITGKYPLDIGIVTRTIKKFEEERKEKEEELEGLVTEYNRMKISYNKGLDGKIPAWEDVFNNASMETKRVLTNMLVSKIYLTNEKIHIQFKVNPGYDKL